MGRNLGGLSAHDACTWEERRKEGRLVEKSRRMLCSSKEVSAKPMGAGGWFLSLCQPSEESCVFLPLT